jgi:hypothetical protein
MPSAEDFVDVFRCLGPRFALALDNPTEDRKESVITCHRELQTRADVRYQPTSTVSAVAYDY